MRIVITGASGVLGSAVTKAFREQGHTFEVVGLANSRSGNGLVGLDLTDTDEVESKFQIFNPDWVIHCAAERRPDMVENDPEAARRLNSEVPGHLASLATRLGFTLVYISTDYVFDGTSPPYSTTSTTNPLQLYGQSKRDGEIAVLGADGAKVIVLRVPVLYGPVSQNSDSAINILLDIVQDQSGMKYNMDHYATRYPTNVVDIANFLTRLTRFKNHIPRVLHYSNDEPYTKYEICLTFAKILGLPHSHIIPDGEPPSGRGATMRPKDCHLYTKETEDLGIEGGLNLSSFEEWWVEYLL